MIFFNIPEMKKGVHLGQWPPWGQTEHWAPPQQIGPMVAVPDQEPALHPLRGNRTGAPSTSLHTGVRSHERQKTPEAPQARQKPPARAPGFRRRSDSVTLPGWQCPLCVTEGLGLTSPATVGYPRFERTMEHTKRPKCHRYRTRLVLPDTQQAKRGRAEVSGRQRFTSKAATRGGRRTSFGCASPKARGWGIFGTKQQGTRGGGSVGDGDGVKACHRVQALTRPPASAQSETGR